jgi:hypothetical protein
MKSTLRDGSHVTDPRLARLQQFDERSKEHPVRALVKVRTPRSYTWPCYHYLDQGPEGTCVGLSVAHQIMAKPMGIKNITAKFATENIYWEAQRNDPWEGGSYPGASPESEGTSVLEGIKIVHKLGLIKEYRWALGLEDLVLALGHVGPAVLGVNWYDGMFDTHACGYLHVTGKVAGGHAIMCKGVNVAGRYFVLHNSWGRTWGTRGDGRISWLEMDRLLHEDGEACIPIPRVAV